MSVKLLTEHNLEFLYKLKGRLHRLVWVYTCQNATLLEITCHSSYHYNSVLLSEGKTPGTCVNLFLSISSTPITVFQVQT